MVTAWFFAHKTPGVPDPIGSATWDPEDGVTYSDDLPPAFRGVSIHSGSRVLTPADGAAYIQALPEQYAGSYLWAELEPEDDGTLEERPAGVS